MLYTLEFFGCKNELAHEFIEAIIYDNNPDDNLTCLFAPRDNNILVFKGTRPASLNSNLKNDVVLTPIENIFSKSVEEIFGKYPQVIEYLFYTESPLNAIQFCLQVAQEINYQELDQLISYLDSNNLTEDIVNSVDHIWDNFFDLAEIVLNEGKKRFAVQLEGLIKNNVIL